MKYEIDKACPEAKNTSSEKQEHEPIRHADLVEFILAFRNNIVPGQEPPFRCRYRKSYICPHLLHFSFVCAVARYALHELATIDHQA